MPIEGRPEADGIGEEATRMSGRRNNRFPENIGVSQGVSYTWISAIPSEDTATKLATQHSPEK